MDKVLLNTILNCAPIDADYYAKYHENESIYLKEDPNYGVYFFWNPHSSSWDTMGEVDVWAIRQTHLLSDLRLILDLMNKIDSFDQPTCEGLVFAWGMG